MPFENIIPLPDLPRHLLRDYGLRVSYLAAWRALTAGSIRGDRIGRRWHVRGEDLPEIASHFAKR